jgi:hypothetical protein
VLGVSERESGRAAERCLIIECTIAIEPSAAFDSPKMPKQSLPLTGAAGHSKLMRSLVRGTRR